MPLSRRGLPWWVNRNFPRAPAASFMEERCGRARAPSVDYQDNTLSHQEGGQNWTPISPLKGVKFRRRLTDWVVAFNADGPDGLLNGKAPGKAPILNDDQRRALGAMVESGPFPATHGVVRWRLVDLAQWVFEEFRLSISKQTLSRELRAMGFRKLSARPRHHAQDTDAPEAFKKTSPPAWTRSPPKRRQESP